MRDLYILATDLGFIPRNRSIGGKEDPYLWMCELQKWLMEEHKIYCYITPFEENNVVFFVSICAFEWCEESQEYSDKDIFYSYPDALEDSLREGLKQLKLLNERSICNL